MKFWLRLKNVEEQIEDHFQKHYPSRGGLDEYIVFETSVKRCQVIIIYKYSVRTSHSKHHFADPKFLEYLYPTKPLDDADSDDEEDETGSFSCILL